MSSASAFLGTYSDPINHPGGTRTVEFVTGSSGDYQLAKVTGGGGQGEPEKFTLPAVILGGRSIIIDFTPKGGPPDFMGVLDEAGGIQFVKDGNVWPRVDSKGKM